MLCDKKEVMKYFADSAEYEEKRAQVIKNSKNTKAELTGLVLE